MIIVKIIGGLGNQMFQYALARSLEKKTNLEVKIDINGFETYKTQNYSLDKLNIKNNMFATKEEVEKLCSRNIIQSLYNNFFSKDNKIFKESTFDYSGDVFNVGDNTYIEGYWQSEKYFKDIENIIRDEFLFKKLIRTKNLELANKIKKTNSISLHIRRGDYINNSQAYKIHGGICTLDYYKRAVSFIADKTKEPHFYVYSDDIMWAKENLELKYPTIFVDWNTGEDSYRDMQLMSLCDHNIIANSTFSWWGAWLNNNKNKIVIAPQKWFNNNTKNDKDLIPNSWERI